MLKPAAWQPYGEGFQKEGDAWFCDNLGDAKAHRGVMQTVVLNQTKPTPFAAAAWSRAADISGASDADYSLYLDLTYADGEHLWGQTAPFAPGSHGWQRRRIVVVPDKPVKSVCFYLLFRNHSGKAWFRDAELRVSQTPQTARVFDGLAVEIMGKSRAGFQIRDVAAAGDFLRLDEKNEQKPASPGSFQAESSGISVQWQESAAGETTFYDVTLTSKTPEKDRAFTLYYALPIAGDAVKWLCNPRRPTPVEPGCEYSETWRVKAGMGRLSRYPLAAVTDDRTGTALAIDMLRPAVFRAAYNSSAGELFLAYDIALTPEKPSAKLRFCHYTFDPAWGFRAALARYYELFPEHFRCRTPQQGIWMPFAPISKVPGWEDFGFKFKEGDGETKWDDAHGILTFRYTEPLTWWMAMPKETPRTFDAALSTAKSLAERGDAAAKALFTSGMHNAAGNFAALMLDTPWCNGAVWSMNSMPGIAGETTDFNNKWNKTIRDKNFGPDRNADLDGEYIDSSEGYTCEELDYRRDHFATADTPLTFSPDEHRPAVFRGLIAFEYARGLADDVHNLGKLMMANSTPNSLCWLAPLLDVLGTETNWNHGGNWQPMSDAEMFYRRALCKAKPYCFLMNTQFDRFTTQLVEKYMRRSLAYGMFPGFFSADASTGHYFSRPELYDRDRPLFKKYVPLCKLVAEAGWEPITAARSHDDRVYVERFGNYLTVFNDSPDRRTAAISLESNLTASSRELVREETVAWKNGRAEITLDGEDVAVIELPAAR